MRSGLALVVVFATSLALAYDPGAPGPRPIGETTITFVDTSRAGRTLVTEVWYPARTAGRDAAPRRGRSPLVLLLHGHCGSRLNYSYLARHLASRGSTVAAPDLPGFCLSSGPLNLVDPPLDVTYLRTALRGRQGPGAALARSLRGKAAAVVAHSLGASVTANAALADPQVRVLLLLAPFASAEAGIGLAQLPHRPAILVAAGSADSTTTLEGLIRPFYDQLAEPSFLLTIVGGSHSGFTDHDSATTPEQHARQQELTRRFVAAGVERYLVRDPHAGRALTVRDTLRQGDDVTLEVHALRR